jgi:hypothetical protein
MLVHFGPGFDESTLAPGKRTCHQLDRINAIDCHVILIVSVEMRAVMRCVNLPVHTNNDTEETAEFRHEDILASRQEQIMRHVLRGMAEGEDDLEDTSTLADPRKRALSGTLRAFLRTCM